MKDRYDVMCYYGIPVSLDNSGNYIFKPNPKIHLWRNGKHTKGTFKKIGQLFLTESNQLVIIVARAKLSFKRRHEFAPFERFTKEFISDTMLDTALSILNKESL